MCPRVYICNLYLNSICLLKYSALRGDLFFNDAYQLFFPLELMTGYYRDRLRITIWCPANLVKALGHGMIARLNVSFASCPASSSCPQRLRLHRILPALRRWPGIAPALDSAMHCRIWQKTVPLIRTAQWVHAWLGVVWYATHYPRINYWLG